MIALAVAILLVERLGTAGLLQGRTWTISGEPDGLWLRVDVVTQTPYVPERPPLGFAVWKEPLRFAVWKDTGQLFIVGPDGAVEGEPINLANVIKAVS